MPEPKRAHHGLTELLVDAGVVTDEQIQAGLARQRETGLRIGETLVEIGAATEEDIGWALARQLGLPLVDLQGGTLDADLLASFPAGVLYRLQAVPLLRSDEGLSFALSDPTDGQVLAHLASLAGCAVQPSVATPTSIRRVLAPRLGANAGAASGRPGHADPSGYVVWDHSGAAFLQFQLHAAQRAGASAIHFKPDVVGVGVYHRGPGGTVRVAHESPEAFEALLTQLEMLGAPIGAMGDDLHRTATLDCPLGAETIRLGVSLLAVDGATTVTLRLPSAPAEPASLESLGCDPVDAACVREALHRPAGLVLVNGPPGAGCTRTLACLLAEALGHSRSAIVFGDVPAPSHASGMTLVLPSAAAVANWEAIVAAHQPEVVVLDDLAPSAVLTTLSAGAAMGRLVIARANWGDTFALLEAAAGDAHSRSALASRLNVVLQQRLVASPVDSGATGLRAVFEVLLVGDALRDAIRSQGSARAMRAIAESEGFHPLSDVLNAELRAGRLDAAAVARAIAT